MVSGENCEEVRRTGTRRLSSLQQVARLSAASSPDAAHERTHRCKPAADYACGQSALRTTRAEAIAQFGTARFAAGAFAFTVTPRNRLNAALSALSSFSFGG